MRRLAKETQDDEGDFADFGYIRKGSFEVDHSSPSSGALSPSANPFSPLLPVERRSRAGFSYGSFSLQPIRLSVLKLDGSSFDIVVTRKATVAKLKQAVEAAFSHLPKQGSGKVSWSHVWSQFCLCFEGQKLLRDRDSIGLYGIQNGDQLKFVRHTCSGYNIARAKSEKLRSGSEEPNMSPRRSRKNGTKTYYDPGQSFAENADVGIDAKCQFNWAGVSRRLFSYHRLEGGQTMEKGNHRVTHSLARLGKSFPHDEPSANKKRDIVVADSDRYILGGPNPSSLAGGFTGSFEYRMHYI